MRIACISASRVPSRTANSIQTLKACQALLENGHDVTLWLPGPAAAATDAELKSHYGLRALPQLVWLRAARVLRRYDFCVRAVFQARKSRAELIYVWPLQAAALASWLGSPTVMEVHDRPQGRLGPWLMRRFVRGRGARRLLVTTHSLQQWLEGAYGREAIGRLAIWAPNGVDLEQYENLPDPAIARKRLGVQERFTAGYTGHLYPGRGLDLMLELARRHPEFQFLWAGGEPEAVGLWKKKASDLGLSNLVLLGFIPNERLPIVQAACEVLLMPYERRIAVSGGGDTSSFASPMKAFDYLASRRPVMASELPVFREILSPQNAMLLPPEDVEAWDRGLQSLQRDPSRRRELTERAAQDASHFGWKERARRALEGLFEHGETA
jgi:glycosyltransferase involved in cell wall biosynthesis